MQDILNAFRLEGKPDRCIPYGSGHINETWLVETDRTHRYILQKVNTKTFPDPEGLMNNIILVTEHLRRKDPVPGHVLTLIPIDIDSEHLFYRVPFNESGKDTTWKDSSLRKWLNEEVCQQYFSDVEREYIVLQTSGVSVNEEYGYSAQDHKIPEKNDDPGQLRLLAAGNAPYHSARL